MTDEKTKLPDDCMSDQAFWDQAYLSAITSLDKGNLMFERYGPGMATRMDPRDITTGAHKVADASLVNRRGRKSVGLVLDFPLEPSSAHSVFMDALRDTELELLSQCSVGPDDDRGPMQSTDVLKMFAKHVDTRHKTMVDASAAAHDGK